MKFVIVLLLTLSCKLMQSGNCMTDTALGNVGLNVKPIFGYRFDDVKEEIKHIKQVYNIAIVEK